MWSCEILINTYVEKTNEAFLDENEPFLAQKVLAVWHFYLQNCFFNFRMPLSIFTNHLTYTGVFKRQSFFVDQFSIFSSIFLNFYDEFTEHILIILNFHHISFMKKHNCQASQSKWGEIVHKIMEKLDQRHP